MPLEYIDVVRRTNTILHVLLESRVDDYWNVDGGREVSEPWPDFTQFTILSEKLPDGHTWSGSRMTKITSNIKGRIFMARDVVKNV